MRRARPRSRPGTARWRQPPARRASSATETDRPSAAGGRATPAGAQRDWVAELERLRQSAAEAAKELEAAEAAVRGAEEQHRTWQQRVRDAQDALENARREEAGAAL